MPSFFRIAPLLLVSLFALSGCAALAEAYMVELAKALEAEEAPQAPADVPPPPAAAGDPNAPTVPAAARRATPTAVTPAMLAAADPIAQRLLRETASARTVEQKRQVLEGFLLTPAERDRVRVLGFESITLEVGAGGNSPYLLGGSLSQGVAFGLTPGDKVYAITSGGITVGVPGAAGDIRLGFWRASVEDLAGWLLGVNGSAVGPKNVGVGVGVFWSIGAPPVFQGFSVGASFSQPGPGADAGLAWTEYTQQILNTISDAGTMLTGGETQHGAEIGEACTVGADCRGYSLPIGPANPGVACCSGRCERTKKDYAGVSWCPAVCRRSLFAAPGTCD